MTILADLQTAAARKWTNDPACQQAGLFWRAVVEIERLTAALKKANSQAAGDTMSNKITLTLEDLGVLAQTAERNGTSHAWQAVALEWCGQANAEIERLTAERDAGLGPRWWNCATHGRAQANDWGCPGCVRELRTERDALKATLRDEMDENLRLRDLGGAKPDENIGAMTERLIRERDDLRAELGRKGQ